jgi:hypothetical protein
MYKLLLVVVSALALCACSEPDQRTTLYNGHAYSGKTDAQPWANSRFDGDKAAWGRALTVRTNNQNEYPRMP